MAEDTQAPVGKAYWLTNTPLPLEELLPLMPDTTDAAQSPTDMGLKFVYVQDQKSSDRLTEVLAKCASYGLSATSLADYQMPKELSPLVESAKSQGLTYIIEASVPGASNKQVEGELSTVASLAFHPAFFPNKAIYRGLVTAAEADGRYIVKDDVDFAQGIIVD